MITISFYGWMIPLVITLVTCGCALYIPKDNYGLDQLVLLVPALLVSMLSWMIWGILT